jgi:hypothetical protein
MILLQVALGVGVVIGVIAAGVWLCSLWAYASVVLLGGGFIALISFVIWIDQGVNS